MITAVIILLSLSTSRVFSTDTGTKISKPFSPKMLAVAKDSTIDIVPPLNKTTLESSTLYTEGGIQIQKGNTIVDHRDKKAQANLGASADAPEKITSPVEVSATKKRIIPRKGANLGNESDASKTSHANSLPIDTSSNTSNNTDPIVIVNNATTSNEPSKIEVKNDTVSTTVPHKPLLLSGNELEMLPMYVSSEVYIESSARLSKSASSSAHPDLLIPMSITVFALPLLAVLGYYALKQGREAWKNRHYRRMDFLLDGMYND